MKNRRFSIIICAYNVEKYIGQAIESVLNQSFKDFELIISNDASIDNTLRVIKSYKDSRVKIINNKNNRWA